MKPVVAFAGCVFLSLSACSRTESVLAASGITIVGDTIPVPLTEKIGSASEGARIFADREAGHCVLCHVVSSQDAEFQGNVGPDLSLIGDRLSPGQIRLRIVDYQALKPDVLMPSYYRTHGFRQVAEAYAGQTVLSAEEVEHLVAYLSSLKEPNR